jgi:hypothetical protein
MLACRTSGSISKLKSISMLACAAFAAGVVLVASPAFSQEVAEAAGGVFGNLGGTWSGTGMITMKDGGRERLHCRGSYVVDGDGANLRQELKCASDSYKFEMSTDISQTAGQLAGNWTENTRHIAGRVTGRATPTQIQARAEGDTFTALLAVTTRGDKQTVSIQSPGAEVSDVSITMTRSR